MSLQTIYLRGNGPRNEDAYLCDPDHALFAVIDGATGLSGPLNGADAAQAIRSAFLAERRIVPLAFWVQDAVEAIAERTRDIASVHPDQLPAEERASAGFVLTRWIGDGQTKPVQMEFAHAGDCMLFVRYHDGEVRSLTWDRLARFDDAALSEMTRYAQQGHPHPRGMIQDTLVQNRKRLNVPGGYGALDGSTACLGFVEYGTIPLNGVQDILMLSDGLYDIRIPILGMDGWMMTAERIFAMGLQAYVEELIEIEEADPECRIYPRFKKADDKTGLWIPGPLS